MMKPDKLLGWGCLLFSGMLLVYDNIFFGTTLFAVGGYLLGFVNAGLRGSGVVIMVFSAAYGLHNEFSYGVVMLFCMGAGFVAYTFCSDSEIVDSALNPDNFYDSDGGGGGDGGGGD